MIIEIDLASLAIAGMLLGINLAISRCLKLDIEKALGMAAIRMVIQLTAIGFLLEAILSTHNVALAGAIFLAMMLFAAREVRARPKRMLRGAAGWWVSGLGLSVSSILATVFLLLVVIRPDPWWNMQYAVPLFGMLLGNAMNGVALTLNNLLTGLERDKGAIENALARGMSMRAALKDPIRQAVSNGTMPAINSMAATGVVFLPGLMVGQILSGVPPLTAVKYQMLLMVLLASGTALAVVMTVLLAAVAVTDKRQRLRLDRLLQKP